MGKTYKELSKELYYAKKDIEGYEYDYKKLHEKFDVFKKMLVGLKGMVQDTTDDLTDYQKQVRMENILKTFNNLIDGANPSTVDSFSRWITSIGSGSTKDSYRNPYCKPKKPISDHDAHCLAIDICDDMGWDYD